MASKEQEEAKNPKLFKYDVFLVHSTLNEKVARQINEGLVKQGLDTYAHYKEGISIVEGIKDAVEKSQTVLVLLTPEAMESHWVTFELLLSFEKSVASGEMCLRLVVYDLTDEQLKDWKDLESIPKVRIDFNRDDWAARLEDNIKEKVEMTDILPAGNVALGLVYNYFAGFLNHILPVLKSNVENSTYYKENKNRMLKKFIVLLPESCQIPKLDGQFDHYTIVKEDSLNIETGHGDKLRSYKPAIYSIKKEDKVLYFLGESPTIMETLAKLSKFVPTFDKRLQVTRFRQTLMDFVNHKCNAEFNDTVAFVEYDDERHSHAEELWKTINSQMGRRSAKIERKVGRKDKKDFATVTNSKERHDQKTAHEVMGQLNFDHISFDNDDGKLSLNYLKDARWNIFVMSNDSTNDPAFLAQYHDAIHESINDNEVQVIPILTEDTTISDIPQISRWTTVLQSSHPDYLNQLSKTMDGKSSKMEECWPAGDIYVGLGWSYLLNYLPIVLLNKMADGKDLLQRFKDGIRKYNTDSSKCIPCVFIMIPKTCQFPPPGPYFDGEIHLGSLEPVVVGYRKYFLQFYQITLDNGESVCYAREYATPAVTLHEMAQKFPKSSGLNIPEMYEQSRKLAEFLVQVIGSEEFQTTIGDISTRCTIVHFDVVAAAATADKGDDEDSKNDYNDYVNVVMEIIRFQLFIKDEKMDISEMTTELKKILAQCNDFISPSASSAS